MPLIGSFNSAKAARPYHGVAKVTIKTDFPNNIFPIINSLDVRILEGTCFLVQIRWFFREKDYLCKDQTNSQ